MLAAIRSTSSRYGDARWYHPVLPDSDIIGLVKVQGGNITGLGQDVRTIDDFFKGGETVRGFETLGYGPRDARTDVPLGGKNFWATSAEVQFPMPVLPPDFGIRGAVFADAGALWGLDIPNGAGASRHQQRHLSQVVGGRLGPLGVSARSASRRLRLRADEAAARPVAVVPVQRRHPVLTTPRLEAGPSANRRPCLLSGSCR